MNKTVPVEKNDQLTLAIDALGSDGQGIGRVEGYAVFVPGALPGERVRAHVLKTTSGYAVAKLNAIEEAAPERVEPPCPAFPKCGGCTLQHMSYPAQLQMKKQAVADAFRKIGQMADAPVAEVMGMEEPWRYRNKGSFPYALYGDTVAFGFFAPRSHRLVPLSDCPIQNAAIIQVAAAVRDWAYQHKVSIYDEESHMGALRHCMARVAADGSVMAVVVTHGKLSQKEALVELLQKRVNGLVSVIHNRNDARTNVILGEAYTCIWGKDTLEDSICGLKFSVSAASFLQVNALQTERLYQEAIAALALQGDETVMDVYCGIGTISLLLAQHAKRVVGVDNVPEAIEDACKNAAANRIGNAEFLCGDAERLLPELVAKGLKPDAAVVDPPRKGCETAALQAIVDCGAKKLAYVSCNPATLARDCRFLCDNGFTLVKVQPVDMFPHTAHVETIVLLQRENS